MQPYEKLISSLNSEGSMNIEERTDMLIEGAKASGFTIDFLEMITQDLDNQALRKVIGNASAMPSYMKSSDKPYVLRKANAPSSESR